jgi:hypothetical protein
VDHVQRIADAVLYEGYLLWPYRRSALKNQRRWTFGGVYPAAHAREHPDDACVMRTQCLLEAPDDAIVDVRVRFLHLLRRDVLEATPGGLTAVDELTVDGERHLAWEEAVEREIGAPGLSLAALAEPHRVPVDVPAETAEEPLTRSDGTVAGALRRSWRQLEGSVTVGAERLGAGLHRVTVTIENTSAAEGLSREAALARTLCSTHTVLRARAGGFASLTDPPEHLREAAAACRNTGTWPVLVGEPNERHTLLSSPIILEDHPRIAPESPGDLFDGGEIDQLLILNILSLTDAEKAEMRDSDPRAREILERTEALTADDLMRLHGTVRELAVRER